MWTRPGGQSWREVKHIIDFVKEHEDFPQLYIYSAADMVVLSSSIEAHMQARAPGTGMALLLLCVPLLRKFYADARHSILCTCSVARTFLCVGVQQAVALMCLLPMFACVRLLSSMHDIVHIF